MIGEVEEVKIDPRELEPLQTVADRVGLSRRAVEAFIAAGSVRAFRIGGRILLREVDVRAAFAASEITPTAEN